MRLLGAMLSMSALCFSSPALAQQGQLYDVAPGGGLVTLFDRLPNRPWTIRVENNALANTILNIRACNLRIIIRASGAPDRVGSVPNSGTAIFSGNGGEALLAQCEDMQGTGRFAGLLTQTL